MVYEKCRFVVLLSSLIASHFFRAHDLILELLLAERRVFPTTSASDPHASLAILLGANPLRGMLTQKFNALLTAQLQMIWDNLRDLSVGKRRSSSSLDDLDRPVSITVTPLFVAFLLPSLEASARLPWSLPVAAISAIFAEVHHILAHRTHPHKLRTDYMLPSHSPLVCVYRLSRQLSLYRRLHPWMFISYMR